MEFDVAAFRRTFPAFADETLYPDEAIIAAAGLADCYINLSARWFRCEQCVDLMRMLIVAHILTLNGTAFVPGQTATGVMTSASIDGISVGFSVNSTSKGSFLSWLGKTPYGEQLAAILARYARGFGYVGGTGERRAFRKVGGRF